MTAHTLATIRAAGYPCPICPECHGGGDSWKGGPCEVCEGRGYLAENDAAAATIDRLDFRNSVGVGMLVPNRNSLALEAPSHA